MRIKALLTSILLASTTIAGVASASPRVRDHRDPAPVRYRPASYQAQVTVQTRPSWMVNANVNYYGYQLAANGTIQPYAYGNDPYVEGIARGEWSTLQPCAELIGAGNVRLDLSGRSLTSIELQATRGGANITHAGIQFTDGRTVPVEINRSLDVQHAPNLRIDLGREGLSGVKAVVVYGKGNAAFRVLGA